MGGVKSHLKKKRTGGNESKTDLKTYNIPHANSSVENNICVPILSIIMFCVIVVIGFFSKDGGGHHYVY